VQWRALHEDPQRVAPVVEEVLRTQSVGGNGIPRYARTGLDIAGTTVRPGELVLLDIGAANHDAEAFADPDRFDATRRAAAHVTFGHGARYCLGAPLARIELQVVLSLLAARFPAMRLAVGLDELRIHTGALTGGLVELPVTW
jgi:pentalenolactone synthase